MHYTVYRITNKINGKVYIGKHQTKDLNDGYMGSGKLLHKAYQKYGVENFSKEILFTYECEDLMNAKEAELVTEEFCLQEDTYNICVGGQGGFSYINREGLNLYGRNGDNVKLHSSKGGLNRAKHMNEDLDFRTSVITKTSNSIKNGYVEGRIRYNPLSTDSAKIKHSISVKNNSKGEKNSQFGSMWITNGTENKKIKKVDNIPEGWYKGRI